MWEGDTNLLLSAGVGGTFMKAFGTAFTGAGLVSCHTHTGAPVGGRALLRGPAAPRAGQSIVPTRQRVRVRWCRSRAREAVVVPGSPGPPARSHPTRYPSRPRTRKTQRRRRQHHLPLKRIVT